MSEKNQSKFQVLKFAVIVCLACSLVVSASAIALRSFQEKNVLNEKRINILRAAGLVNAEQKVSNKEIEEKFQSIIPVVVNLSTGELDLSKNPQTYDMYAVAQSKNGIALTNDPANIKRIAPDGSAYILVENNQVKRIILPIQGYGLWSTMYGFTALDFGKNPEITGITFYSQAETPGLGAEVTNPKWQANWNGVLPYNSQGEPDVRVMKNVNHANKNEVDAIAGATLTSRGVEHLMNFWLGEQGYRKFIENVESGKITIEQMKQASNQDVASHKGGA